MDGLLGVPTCIVQKFDRTVTSGIPYAVTSSWAQHSWFACVVISGGTYTGAADANFTMLVSNDAVDPNTFM
jgi:hypothetical protein